METITVNGFSVIEKDLLKTLKKTSNCWNWKLTSSNGYGRFGVNGFRVLAHRFSFMIYNGSILEGNQINHKCRNKMCVNPKHLEQVSPKQNTNYHYNGDGW